MNHWMDLSIQYANQRSYLDDLFQVYPTIPEGIRDLDEFLWRQIEQAFERHNNTELITQLLKLKLFPIKDSYVAYLRRDKTAIARNPATIARLCGRLYEMGLGGIQSRCTEPKETNRQIGPLFRGWINKMSLGLQPVKVGEFMANRTNAILDAGDAEMLEFAKRHLNYQHPKGLDFIARFNNKYVIGEAKFLTDFGGHQNAQFNDAISTLQVKGVQAIPIAVLDGVVYIKSNNKMFVDLTTTLKDHNIMSALVLREFLYQV